MVYVIDVDPEKCTGCRSCVVACSLKRERICRPILGRIQVATYEEQGIHVPVVCQQCEDAPCQRVCPADALRRDSISRVITVNYDRCIGCRYCVVACPFGAMSVNVDTGKVLKCDHCEGDPICVKFCHPEAIRYVPLTHALYTKRKKGAAESMAALVSSTT